MPTGIASWHIATMKLALVARRETETNRALAAAAPAGLECEVLSPERALLELGPGDAALCRLDVLPTLDGVDDGLWALGSLEAGGVRVLNPASALLAAHDKLLTARLLRRAGLPHPRTSMLQPGDPVGRLAPPVVVKPRFGSWGRDVVRCDDELAFHRHLRSLESTPWFRTHGALVQELVPTQGRDLRIIVAGGIVVGAIARIAPPGEWRTNVSLGSVRLPVEPTPRRLGARRRVRRRDRRRPDRRRSAAGRLGLVDRPRAQRRRRVHCGLRPRRRPVRRRDVGARARGAPLAPAHSPRADRSLLQGG